MSKLTMIAIAASKGVGDGLITLVLANNLAKNNFDVTVFSNPISQLNGWFPNFTIVPYPKADLLQTLNQFDLVFADAYSEVTKNIDEKNFPMLAKKFVFFCMADFDSKLIYDQSDDLAHRISDPEKLQKLLPLVKGSGVHIGRLDNKAAMIDRMAIFCDKILQLKNVTHDNGIVPLPNLIHHRFPKRIIIHPTSSNPVKNWPPIKFIALATKLKSAGFEPVFTVSPTERVKWKAYAQDKFSVPEFPTLSELAKFVYESGHMIGNDSGVGHLASNLGIPTLTICRTGNKFFRWRPGWSKGIVIKTKHKLKFFGKQHWHWLISVNKVYRTFLDFVQ